MRVEDLTRQQVSSFSSTKQDNSAMEKLHRNQMSNDYITDDAIGPLLLFPTLSMTNKVTGVLGFFGEEANLKLQHALDAVSVFFVSIFSVLWFNELRETGRPLDSKMLQTNSN